MALTLVTGPVRSGKSRYVVEIAQSGGRSVKYVATASREPGDGEWDTRLQRHMRDRPSHWEMVESASLTHDALLHLFASAAAEQCIIVDALGTWLAARIATNIESFERDFARFEERMDGEAAQLAAAMLDSKAQVIVVAEEVGWISCPWRRRRGCFATCSAG